MPSVHAGVPALLEWLTGDLFQDDTALRAKSLIAWCGVELVPASPNCGVFGLIEIIEAAKWDERGPSTGVLEHACGRSRYRVNYD